MRKRQLVILVACLALLLSALWYSFGSDRGGSEHRSENVSKTKIGNRFSSNREDEDLKTRSKSRPIRTDEWILKNFTKKNYNKDKFATFLPNGKISPQAIAAAELDESESIAIQEIFDRQKMEIGEIMASRIQATSSRQEGEIACYQIPSFENLGGEIFTRSIRDVDRLIGGRRREQLLSGYNPSDSFFSYGRYDATVSILQSPQVQPGYADQYSSIRITTVNPKTGKKNREFMISLSQFEQQYGRVLDLE